MLGIQQQRRSKEKVSTCPQNQPPGTARGTYQEDVKLDKEDDLQEETKSPEKFVNQLFSRKRPVLTMHYHSL